VLSVAKALSIQAHPDRELAAALHALRPATYRDANHKPEMAVAVTEFHALCGFAATQVPTTTTTPVPAFPCGPPLRSCAPRAFGALPRKFYRFFFLVSNQSAVMVDLGLWMASADDAVCWIRSFIGRVRWVCCIVYVTCCRIVRMIPDS
jgi:hypothetical protein